MTIFAPASQAPTFPPQGRRGLATTTAFLFTLALVVVVLAAIHLTQGTSDLSLTDLVRVLLGAGDIQDAVVVTSARLPRMLAGLSVGIALGVAGATLQSICRNPLASPDTLAVNAGAYLALTLVAAFGVSLPLLSSAGVAFVGGLAAAALVLTLGGGGGRSTIRLVLGGSVLALALAALTSALLLVFSQETTGLFAWGAGSLGQSGPSGVTTMAGPIAVSVVLVLALGGRFDLLQLGDEPARLLGVGVLRVRVSAVLLAVLLAASAVTLAGPIGFVGLCAPAIVRWAGRGVRGLHRNRPFLLASGLVGVIVTLSADIIVRMFFGALDGVEVPTGVVTTLIGASALVIMARGARHEPTAEFDSAHRLPVGHRYPAIVLAAAAVLLAVLATAGLLLGDRLLLLGDVTNWLQGIANPAITFTLDARWPRLLAACAVGAALAVSGALVQTVTRNPLADPGILGVSSGAALGAVLTLVAVPGAGTLGVLSGAVLGALASGLLVLGLGASGGMAQTRLVLLGLGVSAATTGLINLLVTRTDPWNQAKAITWLGGSTYGAAVRQQLPVLAALILVGVLIAGMHRELDLVQYDEIPQSVGVPVPRVRLVALVAAIVLTGVATASMGLVGFVGLVAPHLARRLMGRRHARFVPMAALLGAALVLVADTAGRTVIAPGQLPAGMVAALVGAPFFCHMLVRSR